MRPKQPDVPYKIRIGDLVQWRESYTDTVREGTVTDILSTQFLIDDRSGHTHVVPFKEIIR